MYKRNFIPCLCTLSPPPFSSCGLLYTLFELMLIWNGAEKKSDHEWSGWGVVGNDTLITVYTLWLFWPIATRWDCPFRFVSIFREMENAICSLWVVIGCSFMERKKLNKSQIKLSWCSLSLCCCVVLSPNRTLHLLSSVKKLPGLCLESATDNHILYTLKKKMLFIKSQVIAVKCKHIFTKSRLTKRIYRISCSPWYHRSDKIIQKTGRAGNKWPFGELTTSY